VVGAGCPGEVAAQADALDPQHTSPIKDDERGTYWLPLPSVILGIISVIDVASGGYVSWTSTEATVAIVFTLVGLTMGIISVSHQRKGRGLALGGIVLCSIGLPIALAVLRREI
jgi:hypothetical protein